ncbi:MAG: MBL fold metallo-hydrolase [Candidatus Omnitrophota bacterium]|nr:MBL fold metallo-hydrolase [Candidatus Omnitrophota bacterium]
MAQGKVEKENFIKFLGTAGARFVMLRQLRASAGIWVSFKGTNVLIDPGPGSLVRCLASKPKLDPSKLDAVILTHRHLDHANDANVILEAMTEGGFKERGALFAPADVFEAEPIVLRHLREIIHIELLKPHTQYSIGSLKFSTGMRHIHSSETYGFKFEIGKKTISLISDTRYFDGINEFYKADTVIINVVFYEPHPEVDHLSLMDAKKIINDLKPKETILTHFGMTMLKAKPHLLEERLRRELNTDVICAYDGMTLEL